MKAWQNVLIGFLGGLLIGGIILLFFLPQRGEPIQLVTATPEPAAATHQLLHSPSPRGWCCEKPRRLRSTRECS